MVVLMVTIGTWMAMYFRTSWTSCGFSLTRRRRFLPKPCCTHCVRKTVATTTRILCDQDISKCDRVRQGRAATYQRHNHQHIVDTKLANFDLCKHSQDNDDHGDDHCGPDAPYEGRPRSAVVCESWAIADIDRTLHSVGGYKSTVGRRQYQEEDHTGDQIMIGVGILVERDTERNCDTGNRR